MRTNLAVARGVMSGIDREITKAQKLESLHRLLIVLGRAHINACSDMRSNRYVGLGEAVGIVGKMIEQTARE